MYLVQGGGATLRADAVALVEAALQFDRGVDRRFLDIMKEFLSGKYVRLVFIILLKSNLYVIAWIELV